VTFPDQLFFSRQIPFSKPTGPRMFLDSYKHALDPKGRVVVPSNYRSELQGVFYLAMGDHGQIEVWPKADFEDRVKEKKALAKGNQQLEYELRTFAASACEVEMDGQFRVAISARLRARAGLEPGTQLILNGMIERFEIWTEPAFALYEAPFVDAGPDANQA